MITVPDIGRSLQGTILGTAVGDALGLPAEGISPGRLTRLWNGEWNMRLLPGRGMCSDDTEHTYAVVQSLAEHPDNPEAFGRCLASRLRWWFLALPAGTGLGTAKACLRLWFGIPAARSGVFSAGNGPAMRSAVIGVFFRDDPVKRRSFVRASTLITHSDPKAEAAACAVADAAACASLQADRDAFVSSLGGYSSDSGWQNAVRLLRDNLSHGASTQQYAHALGLDRGVSGYAFHSVPVALYAWLRHPDDFAAALTAALGCGGDTDTVGAITGGIAGAGTGPEAIPARWRSGLFDWPLTPAKLEQAGQHLAAGQPPSPILWPARLARNLIFLFIVILHGLRRLLPPY